MRQLLKCSLQRPILILKKCFEIYILERNVFWLYTNDCFAFWLRIFYVWEKSLGLFTGMMGHYALLAWHNVCWQLPADFFFLLQCFYRNLFQLSAKTEQRTPSLNWNIENVLDYTVRACATVTMCGKGMAYLKIFDREYLAICYHFL